MKKATTILTTTVIGVEFSRESRNIVGFEVEHV